MSGAEIGAFFRRELILYLSDQHLNKHLTNYSDFSENLLEAKQKWNFVSSEALLIYFFSAKPSARVENFLS